MNKYRSKKSNGFENSQYIGAFADISFEIISESEYGEEKLVFNTRLHYYEKGSGETLLLLHGLGQSLYTWRNNIDFFAANGFRVIALDMAGFGYSGHPNIYYTIEENVCILRAFMDAMKIKKAHIAGVSTGAQIALLFAAKHPKYTNKLILVTPGAPNENYPFLLKLLTTWFGAISMRLFLSEKTIRNVLNEFYFNATLLNSHVVNQYYLPFKNKDTRETLIRWMKNYDDSMIVPLLKSITNKTLIFSGADDRQHSEKEFCIYAQRLKFAHHYRLRNCAQNVHEEKPDIFNKKALEFLQAEDEQASIWLRG